MPGIWKLSVLFSVCFFFKSIKKWRGWYPEYNYALKKLFFLILKFLLMEHLPYAGHCAKFCTRMISFNFYNCLYIRHN